MKELIKYIGIIVILVGVAVLAIPQYMGTATNSILLGGLSVIIIGLIVHIVINRNID